MRVFAVCSGIAVQLAAVRMRWTDIGESRSTRIFQLGFTTKPEGNGLGLHYSACAALELHGKLTAESAGIDRGATFKLVLPLDAAAAAAA